VAKLAKYCDIPTTTLTAIFKNKGRTILTMRQDVAAKQRQS